MLRRVVASAVLAMAVVAGPLAGASGAARPAALPDDVRAGELLVAFDPTLPASARASLRARNGLAQGESLPVPGLELVELPDRADPTAVAARLSRQLGVRYAEPNYRVEPAATPNDTYFSHQWGLHNTGQTGGSSDADIDAPEAWDLAADTSGIVVAVVDTGVDISHPDLAANIWKNTDEVAGNGVDDDGNGYVDDVRGWDYLNGDADVYDSASDDAHGTHVAGTISAVTGNGRGVAGVSQAKILPLKFLGPDGGSTSDAVRAIDYAVAQGAHVINNSWGGPSYSQALADAISRANTAGVLVVAAAGNGGTDGIGDNLDVSPVYPAAHTHGNIIAVAASDASDRLPSFTNYGSTSVDLGAPGAGILSTVPGGYGTASGSSMAAPHVSGAAAQVMAAFPSLSHTEVRQRILATVDPKTSLATTTATGGRLNLAAALSETDVVDGGGSGGSTGGGGTTGGGGGTSEPTPGGTDAEAGDTVSTDSNGTVPSDTNPVVLDLTTPVAGTVELVKSSTVTAAAGYRMVPSGVDITAPEATAARPLVIEAHVATSAMADGAPVSSLQVFRNGTLVPSCDTAGATSASPDPCVSARRASDGVATLTVLTSRASTWTFGVPTVSRIAGEHRLATAVATSRAGFGRGEAGAVVLARSDAFPDALAGAGLAVAENGPLLLTGPNDLHSVVVDELRRVLPSGRTVHLLGGAAALSPDVADQVRALGYEVVRHAGADRFATAVAIAEAASADPLAVLVTTGRHFPDALTASAAASAAGGVVVLTDGERIPAATSSYLAAHPDAVRYAIGGPAAVALPEAISIAGSNRYETATLVADRFFTDVGVAGVATGRSFSDALGAGARLGRLGGPLVLVDGELSGAAERILGDAGRVELFGGTSALPSELENSLHALLR